MVIVYITFGFVSGLIAAIVTLLSGSGFLTALLAYVLAGLAGMGTGLLWSMAPRHDIQRKPTVTQRS